MPNTSTSRGTSIEIHFFHSTCPLCLRVFTITFRATHILHLILISSLRFFCFIIDLLLKYFYIPRFSCSRFWYRLLFISFPCGLSGLRCWRQRFWRQIRPLWFLLTP